MTMFTMFAALVLLLAAVSLAVGLSRIYFVKVPYFMGLLITDWWGRARPVGPGWKFIGRPFEATGESTSLKEKCVDDKMDAETSEEEVVTLDYSMEYWAVLKWLPTFLSFTQAQIESAIKQRVKSLVSAEVRKLKTRDEVLDQLPAIAAEVGRQFNALFAAQYGVGLRFLVDDPELPPELAKEAIAVEVIKKTAVKRDLEIRATNKVRGKEIKKLESMAAAMVKKASEQNPPQILDFTTAMKVIQTHLSIIKETSTTNGLNRDTLSTLEKVLPVVVDRVFGRGNMDESTLEKVFTKILKEVLDGSK